VTRELKLDKPQGQASAVTAVQCRSVSCFSRSNMGYNRTKRQNNCIEVWRGRWEVSGRDQL